MNSKRWLKTTITELKKGDWVWHDNRAFIVASIASSHQGRGSRSFVLSMKPAVTDSSTMTSLRPTAQDIFEKMEIKDVSYTYLYSDSQSLFLCHPETFEEQQIPLSCIDSTSRKYLADGMSVKLRITVDDERPIQVLVPRILHLKVTELNADIATLENSIKVAVPSFIKVGDVVVIDTTTNQYSSRVSMADSAKQ